MGGNKNRGSRKKASELNMEKVTTRSASKLDTETSVTPSSFTAIKDQDLDKKRFEALMEELMDESIVPKDFEEMKRYCILCGQVKVLGRSAMQQLERTKRELCAVITAKNELSVSYKQAEHELTILNTVIHARGHIEYAEVCYFPTWLLGSKNINRFMKWCIAITFELSPELRLIHWKIDDMNLTINAVCSAIVNLWGGVTTLRHGHLGTSLKAMAENNWESLYKKLGVIDETNKACVKILLTPIVRGIKRPEKDKEAEGTFHCILDIQFASLTECKDTDSMEKVVGNKSDVRKVLQHLDEKEPIARFYVLIFNQTYNSIEEINKRISVYSEDVKIFRHRIGW